MAYKWSNPGEWLLETIDNATFTELHSIAVSLANEMDSDTIQDLFQSDMDKDGYFQNDDKSADDSDDMPDEDSITTSDHRKFWQYGKIAFELSENEDINAGIKRELDRMRFWPNVFFISDHGNAHLIHYWEV